MIDASIDAFDTKDYFRFTQIQFQIHSHRLLRSCEHHTMIRQVSRPLKRQTSCHPRYLSSQPPQDDYLWSQNRVTVSVGHNFPDFIEHWSRDNFRKVGYGLGAGTGALGVAAVIWSSAMMTPAVVAGILTTAYWKIGLEDMKQTSHAIRRNYPVLGNMRYIFETVSLELELETVKEFLLFISNFHLKNRSVPRFDNILWKMISKEDRLTACVGA